MLTMRQTAVAISSVSSEQHLDAMHTEELVDGEHA